MNDNSDSQPMVTFCDGCEFAGDHQEGTKVACKITEERRVVLQSSQRTSSSSGESAFHKARSKIFELFNKSKIQQVAKEQKIFLNNFKGSLLTYRIGCPMS